MTHWFLNLMTLLIKKIQNLKTKMTENSLILNNPEPKMFVEKLRFIKQLMYL